MTMFTRLPVSAPAASNLPYLSEADMEYFVNYEPTSYADWIFDKPNASTLKAVNSGKTLTLQGASPSYFNGYVRVSTSPFGNSLLTDFIDTENAVDTVCMVVRDPTVATGNKVLWGNYASSAVGSGAFLNYAQPNRKLSLIYGGIPISGDTGLLFPSVDKFYFVAVSRDFSKPSKQFIAFVGGQSAFTASYSGTYNPGVNQTINIGSTNYTPSGSPAYNDVAEFIIFPKALSAAELQAVYLRRKAKLAGLGIAVA